MSRKISNTLRLGGLVSEYKGARSHIVKLIIVTLVFSFIAAFVFSGVFSREMANNLPGKIVLTILAAMLSLPAFAGAYMLWSRRASSLALYENGIIYRHGKREFITAWDEIASFTEHAACRIEKRNGEAFDFGANVEGYADAAEAIKEETLRQMLPPAKAALLDGAKLQFKGLWADDNTPARHILNQTILGGEGFALDAHGITAVEKGKRIAWSDVVSVGVVEESYGRGREIFFSISDPNISLQMRYGTLPNAHLLSALCEEMVSLKQNLDPDSVTASDQSRSAASNL